MAARRCSTCSLDYPVAKTGPCVVCGGELNHFSNVDAMEPMELIDSVKKLVWRNPTSFNLYGGATNLEKFQKTIDSLRGADDFLLECGDWPAPVGNDERPPPPKREILGPPFPTEPTK